MNYWDAFKTLSVIKDYLKKENHFSEQFRNSENGGNLIFRPIGFLPLIKASIRIKQKNKIAYKIIFAKFDKLNFEMHTRPWLYVLWNPIEKRMIMSLSSLTELLLLYLFDKKFLKKEELGRLKEGYAASLSIEDSNKIKNVLRGIK